MIESIDIKNTIKFQETSFKILNELALKNKVEKYGLEKLHQAYCDSNCSSDMGCTGDKCGYPE